MPLKMKAAESSTAEEPQKRHQARRTLCSRSCERLRRAARAWASSLRVVRTARPTPTIVIAAHANASAVEKPSVWPKKSPLPSTAMDSHQSLKLVPTASAPTSSLVFASVALMTFSWCIRAWTSTLLAIATSTLAKPHEAALAVRLPGWSTQVPPTASRKGTAPAMLSKTSEAALAPSSTPTTNASAPSQTFARMSARCSSSTTNAPSSASVNHVGAWSLSARSSVSVLGLAQITIAAAIAPAHRPATRQAPQPTSAAEQRAIA